MSHSTDLQPPLRAGHLSVEYDPRPSSVREARAEVRRQLEWWGLTEREGLVDMAEGMVTDLAVNALRHTVSRFRLTVSAAHGILRCEVRDGLGKTTWFEIGTCRCAPGLVVGGYARGTD